MKTSRASLSMLQNVFPERLHKAYLIQPPWVFNAFWAIISPFIDPITKEKIVIIKGGLERVRECLATEVDFDQFEKSLGGNDDREFESGCYLGQTQGKTPDPTSEGGSSEGGGGSSESGAEEATRENSDAAGSSGGEEEVSSLRRFREAFHLDYLSLL